MTRIEVFNFTTKDPAGNPIEMRVYHEDGWYRGEYIYRGHNFTGGNWAVEAVSFTLKEVQSIARRRARDMGTLQLAQAMVQGRGNKAWGSLRPAMSARPRPSR